MPHSSVPPSDEALLVRRVLSGERAAMDSFFELQFRPLYEFAHYRLGAQPAEVEDVVQDTFVVAFENLAQFDGRSSLQTWLAGIAKNKIRARRRKRRPMPLSDAIEAADSEIDSWLAAIDESTLPGWALEQRETRELVGAALAQLSIDHREALLSKYVRGESTAQVAERSGRSTKAAESMLTRARTAFAGIFTLLARTRGGLE
jgi:RNA polymerase sigma-70 factor (ECF subfamily)